ncbi:MAG: tyrosine-type recombinase/integrase [Nanoarchaeota archaeon]
MKIDPYNHKIKYQQWKEKVDEIGYIEGISKENSEIILKYVFDMELGINVSSKSSKGSRSYIRLNNLKQRMALLAKRMNDTGLTDNILNLNEELLIQFFSKMRNGEIKRLDGGVYTSVVDFVKVFKSFWHWHIKSSKKKGLEIPDITSDLDCSSDKPKWVYLTEEEVRNLWNRANYDYKILIMFLFDTGIRAPTELMNIKVSDFLNNFKELNIRNEISKTFGRRIKLMLCSKEIEEYIKIKGFGGEDYLFTKKPHNVNTYLRNLGKKVFGDGLSLAGQKYSQLTMYDFRHISCCYWLPRYKSESALKFRFGWKKSDKIHYYSEMLGMRDTISQEDLLVDTTKTEIEKRLTKAEKENELLKDELNELREQNKKILRIVQESYDKGIMILNLENR